jgi:hypothetical protein
LEARRRQSRRTPKVLLAESFVAFNSARNEWPKKMKSFAALIFLHQSSQDDKREPMRREPLECGGSATALRTPTRRPNSPRIAEAARRRTSAHGFGVASRQTRRTIHITKQIITSVPIIPYPNIAPPKPLVDLDSGEVMVR